MIVASHNIPLDEIANINRRSRNHDHRLPDAQAICADIATEVVPSTKSFLKCSTANSKRG